MMKNILCYGDSNTWGQIAGSINLKLRLAQRFDYKERWTGVLQQLLGSDYLVIEAALNGRTTAYDETSVIRSSRNGLATLPGILDMHYPLDLVIFMLGTNDLKKEFNATLEQITKNMRMLIDTVATCHLGKDFKAPKVMLISPAPIVKIDSSTFNLFYDDLSIAKSNQLAAEYKQLANEKDCPFLDAGQIVKISLDDGIHFERSSHEDLANVIAKMIKEMKL